MKEQTPATPRGPGRPRTADPDEVYVSAPLPAFVVEYLRAVDLPRGRYVARLFLERLMRITDDAELRLKISEVLYD